MNDILTVLQRIPVIFHHCLHQLLHKIEQGSVLNLSVYSDKTSGYQGANGPTWFGKARRRGKIFRITGRNKEKDSLIRVV